MVVVVLVIEVEVCMVVIVLVIEVEVCNVLQTKCVWLLCFVYCKNSRLLQKLLNIA